MKMLASLRNRVMVIAGSQLGIGANIREDGSKSNKSNNDEIDTSAKGDVSSPFL